MLKIKVLLENSQARLDALKNDDHGDVINRFMEINKTAPIY
jgi:hypothetical protein